MAVAGIQEVVSRMFGLEDLESLADDGVEFDHQPDLLLLQVAFELGPCLLDRIEIRRVRW
jgi:hypothetical protein